MRASGRLAWHQANRDFEFVQPVRSQMQKASGVKGKCVSHRVCCAQSHNYKSCPTKPTPCHIIGLKARPKVFWRWNSYQGIAIASSLSMWPGTFLIQTKIYLDEPIRKWQVLSRDCDNKSTLLPSLCFHFSGLRSRNLSVSQQSYGGLLGWKIQPLPSWNSWRKKETDI